MGLSDLGESQHVAELAKLKFSEEDLLNFSKQISAVLDYAKKIEAIPTDHIAPMTHPESLHLEQTQLREDISENITLETRSHILTHAPEVQADLFLVPKVID